MRNKFKAWNKKLKVMSEPFTLETLCDRLQYMQEGNYYGFSFVKGHYEKNNTEVDDVIFLQFTGENDYNGNEICEGDILQKLRNDGRHNELETGIVVYTRLGYDGGSGAMGFYVTNTPEDSEYIDLGYSDALRDYIIIGNIYENPEIKLAQTREPI